MTNWHGDKKGGEWNENVLLKELFWFTLKKVCKQGNLTWRERDWVVNLTRIESYFCKTQMNCEGMIKMEFTENCVLSSRELLREGLTTQQFIREFPFLKAHT